MSRKNEDQKGCQRKELRLKHAPYPRRSPLKSMMSHPPTPDGIIPFGRQRPRWETCCKVLSTGFKSALFQKPCPGASRDVLIGLECGHREGLRRQQSSKGIGYPQARQRDTMLSMSKSSFSFYRRFRKHHLALCVAAAVCLVGSACAFSATNPWTRKQVMQPATLARILKSSAKKPLLLQVGFESLYVQGHIPGSEYCGPASQSMGIAALKKCVANVSHTRDIVIYCGCCPWQECPNIRPAFKTLKAMGFLNVKVLYIADNFGTDWAQKGYPVAQGE